VANAAGGNGEDAVPETVARLIREYAQAQVAASAPLNPALSLRGDLEIDSLALVSLTIRLGEEFNVDVVESGVEFGQLETVGDLMAVAEKLQAL
jgi:acyl carrier protein